MTHSTLNRRGHVFFPPFNFQFSFFLLLSFFLLHFSSSYAHNTNDSVRHTSSIYMGTQLKLDIASPILIPATTKWQVQHYEMAVNVRLKDRFYPTVEAGYAGGQMNRGDSIVYHGQGGFFRVGADIHPLKKHPNSPHALLIGVRLGTAFQEFEQTLDNKWTINGIASDCWGEIVAGCQVEIAKVNNMAFYMVWMGRFKCLFTRSMTNYAIPKDTRDNAATGFLMPVYIPGFGTRDNIGWGANYYLGWKF